MHPKSFFPHHANKQPFSLSQHPHIQWSHQGAPWRAENGSVTGAALLHMLNDILLITDALLEVKQWGSTQSAQMLR